MPEKYIALANGELTEKTATAASAGAADAGKIVALDGAGKLDQTVMPASIGADTKVMTAFEALAASNLVNVFDDAGTPKVRKADATNGREAHGFVLAAIGAGATGTVYFEGTISGLAGLTGGAKLYLGAGGAMTAVAPSTATHLSQRVATATSATEASFEPQRGITLA